MSLFVCSNLYTSDLSVRKVEENQPFIKQEVVQEDEQDDNSNQNDGNFRTF